MNKIILIFLLCVGFMLNTEAQQTHAATDTVMKAPLGIPVIPADNEDIVFTKCEIPPAYPGGEAAWKKYVSENIHAEYSGCDAGRYTIVIRFIVDKNGYASNVIPENTTACGLEKEAIRLVVKVPQWIPGMQNGHIVKAYARMAMLFTIN